MPSPIPYPPCCVVFVYAGDGESLAQTARSSEWTHVHALAGRGISGVLLLRDAGQHTVLACESLVTQFLGTEAAEGDIAARYPPCQLAWAHESSEWGASHGHQIGPSLQMAQQASLGSYMGC